MNYPDTITITRTSGSAVAVDSEFGMPVSDPVATTVYDGVAFVQEDERLLRVRDDGSIVRGADARVFLPPGDYGIQVFDQMTVTGRDVSGRITRASMFTDRFYTELWVTWQQQ